MLGLEKHADPVIDRLSLQCLEEKILQPKVVYGWFRCRGEGDDLVVLEEDGQTELERACSQGKPNDVVFCISDFFGEEDVIGMSCVTVGEEATARCKSLFESGDFSEYLYLHGFAVEIRRRSAELCTRMRAELGIDADDAVTPEELFRQQYRGSRYSFGYPACPDMADQTKLFRLLQPERIGCRLTENHQIDPGAIDQCDRGSPSWKPNTSPLNRLAVLQLASAVVIAPPIALANPAFEADQQPDHGPEDHFLRWFEQAFLFLSSIARNSMACRQVLGGETFHGVGAFSVHDTSGQGFGF